MAATIATVTMTDTGPVDNVVCTAWLATRFSTPPVANGPPPSGIADGSAVTSGPLFGGTGHVRINVPLSANYYVEATFPDGRISWQLFTAVELASTAAPSLSLANFGSSPPTPTVTGTDENGTISVGTGSSVSGASSITVTYAETLPAGTVRAVQLTPFGTLTAAALPCITAMSNTGFTISFGAALASSRTLGTYQINYARAL